MTFSTGLSSFKLLNGPNRQVTIDHYARITHEELLRAVNQKNSVRSDSQTHLHGSLYGRANLSHFINTVFTICSH